MSDVFISYSRKNSEFARRLIKELEQEDKQAWVDWEGIPLSAPNWWAEIKAGIEAADNFVFIMSPDSMESIVCNLELDYAFELKKRIIPITYKDVESSAAFASIADFKPDEAMQDRLANKDPLAVARDNWHRLSHINWMFFRETDDFDTAFEKLIITVETDLDYVKAHTRLLVRAKDWEDRKKNPSFLIRGDELSDAEQWLGKSVGKSQEPTELHYEYIYASRKYEDERIANLARLERRTKQFRRASVVLGIMIIVALIVMGGLGLFANSVRYQRDEALAIGSQVAGEATLFALEQARVGTLVAGNIMINISDLNQKPEAFLANETAIAELSQWQIQIQEFDGVEMVLVPAACFWMGSIIEEDEQPTHRVCFDDPFWIDRYEVSNQQFEDIGGQAIKPGDWPELEQPRTSVGWLEASDYCALRDARLPSEAEWEYAARGPNSLIYPWGNEFDGDKVHYGQTNGSPLAVSKMAQGQSWVGAYNMSGNVAEWVQDVYADSYSIDTSKMLSGDRVYRGGAFTTLDTNLLRNTYRSSRTQFPELSPSFFIGFRCARS